MYKIIYVIFNHSTSSTHIKQWWRKGSYNADQKFNCNDQYVDENIHYTQVTGQIYYNNTHKSAELSR
jgi:hypothetical protein